ncbi:hypothetical protein HDV00_002999 [Rhizophlyctis rosea]|nr:hypothetical protein HDV00_002999 [Rhizophlyctis rosea]
MSSSTKSYLVGAAAAATVLFGGYLVYFDYKRRNDPAFRKQLRQQRKQALRDREAREAERLRAKTAAAAKNAASASAADIGLDEPVPTGNEEKGEYFLKQLQQGEALLTRGPSAYEEAAGHFFAALRIYPEPMNLLMVFQQSLPEPVLNIIMEKMAADVRSQGAQDIEVE